MLPLISATVEDRVIKFSGIIDLRERHFRSSQEVDIRNLKFQNLYFENKPIPVNKVSFVISENVSPTRQRLNRQLPVNLKKLFFRFLCPKSRVRLWRLT